MNDIARFSHHAAMIALYVSGAADVSIVQAIKSAQQLQRLLESFDLMLRNPQEPQDPEED